MEYDDFLSIEPFYDELDEVQAIAHVVNWLWSNDRWLNKIVDDEGQRELIVARRATIKYPDYLDLVGLPSETNYDEEGQLTMSRKAELLLIGLFKWQDLWIARPAVEGGRWARVQPSDRNYWYVATEPLPDPMPLNEHVFYTPLRFYESRLLAEHIYEQEKSPLKPSHSVLHLDHNMGNCHVSNLAPYNKRGRPMACVLCGHRVVKQNSYRFKHDGIYQRYCAHCVKEIGDWAEGQ